MTAVDHSQPYSWSRAEKMNLSVKGQVEKGLNFIGDLVCDTYSMLPLWHKIVIYNVQEDNMF